MVADTTKKKLHWPRSFCIPLVALLFVVSQITVFYVDNVKNLWVGSVLLGVAYGGLFGLFPVMTIEWFGLCKCICAFKQCPPAKDSVPCHPHHTRARAQPTSPKTGATSPWRR